MSTISDRKIKHIELAQRPDSQMEVGGLNFFELPYCALPEISLENVSTGIQLFGKHLDQPLIIASMTGGADHAELINRNLAIAAQECRVAMGVGSQRIMLKNKDARKSFSLVRKYAPDIFLFGNLGAVQLNYGVTTDDVRFLLDEIQADALYLHLNPLQEALQPEGDTNFMHLLAKISQLTEALDVPVFVKEVGHGISGDVAVHLLEAGVKGVDVAGAGGTSWAWIEAQRGQTPEFNEWFKSFGIPTGQCLEEVSFLKNDAEFMLVASGGIRSPIEGLKALFLGADIYSAAKPFLHAALEGEEECIRVIRAWQKGLQIALFSCGLEQLPEYSSSE